MIGWEDIYKVVVAIAPLYVALTLGYSSVKWWRIFTPEHCEAINKIVCFFTLPLFTFEFAAHFDPFKMNFKFMGADVISKLIIVTVLSLWAKLCGTKASYCWLITSFSLSTLTNALVVGVPLLKAMYGPMAVDLVVQLAVFQALVWLTVLLFVFEIRRTNNEFHINGDDHVIENDVGGNMEVGIIGRNGPTFWTLAKTVWAKLAMNPNSYACIIGITWAFLSNRWHFPMPTIVEGSILIISRAGTGTAMFSMGMFMAMQEKVIACGASLTVFGMALRFIAGPLAMAIGSIAVGLHGDVLRVAIIQMSELATLRTLRIHNPSSESKDMPLGRKCGRAENSLPKPRGRENKPRRGEGLL
ncbi:hypothetical protein RD792_013244, partial [Penstemon davidsonii]